MNKALGWHSSLLSAWEESSHTSS